MLFAGDHIMNGSTVVIIPPSGDMKAYIESLQLLLRYPLKLIAPGHGEVMEDSRAVVEWLVNHRLKRESKVIAVCSSWAAPRWMSWSRWFMTTWIPACTKWRNSLSAPT